MFQITLPSSSSEADLLKIHLILAFKGLETKLTSGPHLLFQDKDLLLTQPLAIVRYIASEELSETETLFVNSWIDWDRQTLIDFEFLESTFKSLPQPTDSIVAYSILPDMIVFSRLFTNASAMEILKTNQYPSTRAWFQHRLKTPLYSKAISSLSQSSLTTENKESINPNVIAQANYKKEKVLPVKGQRNVLVTSALPYVNNVPHLGNIIGCVLSADVFARYCRLRGYNTLYVCGTDEYGTATETKALEEKVSCQELCDKYHKLHRQTYEWFGIDFDIFGRTTTPQQTKIAQDIFMKLDKNGKTIEDTMTQLYCETHKSFLADRFVEGTCPHCNYPDARGDQCDGCGKLLNATDLKNPHCKLDGATPILKDSRHIFLNLTDQQPKLEEWVKKASKEGAWSANSSSITQSWLTEGLKPRCITRDLKWGTPVPKKGFEDKVFYVWFDAPIGYLSITANYTPEWEKWWKNPTDVKLYQFMGKDNVPFHTVIFPSTLLGTNENWTLLHHISTTEYLQYESGKFSKSRGVGVFGNNVMDSGIPVSVWRYYLLSNRPETSDAQFTWKTFVSSNNSELLANIGNFCNRIIKFVNAKYDGKVPGYDIKGPAQVKLIKDVNHILSQYIDSLEACKIRQGLKLVMDLSSVGNSYLQENKIDNALFNDSRSVCDTVVGTSLNLVYLLAALISPFMPTTSESIFKQLKAPPRKITDTWTCHDILPGHVIGKAEYLFTRIDESKENELRSKYAGKQDSGKEESSKQDKKKKFSKPSIDTGNVQKTPEMMELESQIKVQGDLVRQLKTDKADANEIKQQVSLLLKLKADLQQLLK